MNQNTKVQIPFPLLLCVYGIIPFCLVLVVLDYVLWGGFLKRVLPETPDHIFFFALLFVLPHIVASFFSFADGEYLLFYKKRLLFDVPLFMLLCLFVYSLGYEYALIFFVVYTEYHFFSQQAGLGHFYFKTRLPEYTAWKWIAIIVGTIGYGLAYRGVLFSAQVGDTVALVAIPVLLTPFFILTVSMFRRIPTRSGRRYLFAMSAGLFATFVILFAGYPIFAIFCARFIHDVPAFMAYLTHDHNRRGVSQGNLLYRLFGFTHIPVYILAPVLAIGIAFWMVRIPYVAGEIIFLVSMLHYYVEGFIWKKDTIHRRYLGFIE